MSVASKTEVEEFGRMIVEHLGLVFEEQKLPDLAATLNERLIATGSSGFEDYRARLPHSPEEWRTLAERLTIGETYFFRNPDQFRAFLEVALPRLRRMIAGSREIRILSAGCASGEEPYTLAILLRDLEKADPDLSWSLRAIDVNPAAVQRAREARYSRWSLRQMPPGYRERFFRPDGQHFLLDPQVRSAAGFAELNLVEAAPWFWSPGAFDVIFCRNVLMYFSQDVARQVVDRLARSLVPGGFLFLGHAETLRGISQAFHLIHAHDTFFYQRSLAGVDAEMAGEAPAAGTHGEAPALLSPPPAPDLMWYDVIEEASRRISALTGQVAEAGPVATPGGAFSPALPGGGEPPPAGMPPAGGPPAEAVRPQLGPALKALEEERFGEARDLLAELPAGAENDPETLLLRAAVLANCAELEAARNVLHLLLSIDELNPGAHYLMGLCCQQSGEPDRACEHYQRAIYLDPNFAMPHLQLGVLAKRRSDREAARRHLRQAVDLLHREDGARILFFGGGFHRSALLGLCRAELRASGEDRP